MNRYTIINEMVKAVKARTYLEIGVKNGEIFFGIKAPKKIAVDPHFAFSPRQSLHRNRLINKILFNGSELFFETTSDDFFSFCDKALEGAKIDVAFVDGLHTYNQVYRDIQNCLNHLDDKGVIIVHDCNPPAAAMATPVINSIGEVLEKAEKGEIPGWTGNWTGDVWKAIVRLRSEKKKLKIYTIDIDWGVAIILKGEEENTLPFSLQDIDNMTYNDLALNRVQWLNLKEPSFFKQIIAKLFN